jgi:tRNA G46 methylase TrmB
MKKSEWCEGYVADQKYPSKFYPYMSPQNLNAACLFNGIEPICLDKEFTYFELGCGQGLTSTVLAASNPQGNFYARFKKYYFY